ncbi:helix-turn-helix domain-containing protein [Micromonospora sp. ALFpr18c]|uniref:helix-turn-helix domain-containing protein n=1 Tax=unclassified Micromonospora TaxID=2617518 RepID=UPI001788ACBA|nr:helix-turn-helix domain-containing protein [Micromonospora sp. ALFpr18c]
MAERPGVLRVNDRVVFAGTTHTVVAISGSAIRLVSAAGATTVVALPYLLGAADFELVGAAPAPRVDPHGLLEALPAQVVQAARDWERHLIEVETGLMSDAQGAVPRPEYDPAVHPMAVREAAKAAELTAAGTKTSVRTVQRMRRRYREQGLWGLVDARHARTAKPTGNVDARVVAAAAAVIEAQTGTSTGTKSRALRQIRQLLDDEHGPGVVEMPSPATCYRLLEALSAGRYTFGSAVTRRQTANKPAGAYTATTANRPGEQVQLDSTPLDVMAVMDDGVIGRAELVLAIDIATRTICAGVLRPVGAKAVDAALLLARVMVPEPMRPGWDAALAMSATRIPHQRLVAMDARMALAAAKPVIVPDTVVIDHGKVFLSEVFLRAADTLGISVQPAHQQTATDKAIVERTFESINTLFCQHVSGYTGRDVTRRGRDVAERAVWSLPDLQELFDEWVIAGWQTRPHDGLRHPFNPAQAASPNDAYAALVAAAGYVPVALTGEDYIELLPADWRAIGDGGIQIDYRTYNCGELRPYARKNSGVTSRAGRWEVHYDPYDVSRIWVRNHHHGGWITVPWTHHSVVGQPFADFTWRASRKIAAQRGLDDTNEMAVSVILAALLRRAEEGPGSGRALARNRTAHAMGNHLPPELTTAAFADPPEPAPPAEPPQPLPALDPESAEQPQVLVGEVVPFALFNPFADDLEAGR